MLTYRPSARSVESVPPLRLLAEEGETFTVKLIDEDGDAITFASGSTLTLAAKPTGQRDAAQLIINTSATQDDTSLIITLTLNAWTDTVQALGKLLDDNVTNDVIEMQCDASLIYTPSGGAARQSFQFPLIIETPVSLPSDDTPAAVSRATFQVSTDGNYLNFYINGTLVGEVSRILN